MKQDLFNKEQQGESQELVEGVKAFERQRMQDWLKQELRQERQRSLVLRRRLLSVAASVAVLLVVGWLSYNHVTYWDRLEAKYALDAKEVNLMGGQEEQSNSNRPLEQAKTLLQKGETEAAFQAFEKVAIAEESYDDYFQARYQMILIHLAQKEEKEAVQIGSQLLERPEKHYLKAKVNDLLTDLKKPGFLFF